MRIYETILSILEKNGPMLIPSLCQELNKVLNISLEKSLKPSQIMSVITRKKDLFQISGERISIHPDKYIQSIIVTMDGFDEMSYKVHIDFIKKHFLYFSWRSKETTGPLVDFQSKVPGDFDYFKQEVYAMKIWQWAPNYKKDEGIVLEGKYWYVKLMTRGKCYESNGTQCFPDNWNRFSNAIETLTGAPFK